MDIVFLDKLMRLKDLGYELVEKLPGQFEIFESGDIMGHTRVEPDIVLFHADLRRYIDRADIQAKQMKLVEDMKNLAIPFLGDGSEWSAEVMKEISHFVFENCKQFSGMDIIDVIDIYFATKSIKH